MTGEQPTTHLKAASIYNLVCGWARNINASSSAMVLDLSVSDMEFAF